jgi:hypothetical protein
MRKPGAQSLTGREREVPGPPAHAGDQANRGLGALAPRRSRPHLKPVKPRQAPSSPVKPVKPVEPVEPADHRPSVLGAGLGFFFLAGLALAVAVSLGFWSAGFAGSALGGAGAGGMIFL